MFNIISSKSCEEGTIFPQQEVAAWKEVETSDKEILGWRFDQALHCKAGVSPHKGITVLIVAQCTVLACARGQ